MNKKDTEHLEALELFVERLLITMYVSLVLFVVLLLWMVLNGTIHL